MLIPNDSLYLNALTSSDSNFSSAVIATYAADAPIATLRSQIAGVLHTAAMETPKMLLPLLARSALIFCVELLWMQFEACSSGVGVGGKWVCSVESSVDRWGRRSSVGVVVGVRCRWPCCQRCLKTSTIFLFFFILLDNMSLAPPLSPWRAAAIVVSVTHAPSSSY